MISLRVSSFIVTTFLLTMPGCRPEEEDIPHNEVKNWALKFGVNLWLYGNHMTRMYDIQRKYRDATVRKKDGVLLTRDIAAEMKNLMDMKKNAILRIMESAEQTALSQLFEEESKVRAARCEQLKEISTREQPRDEFEMTFKKNRHFEYHRVNTTFSCLLFPATVSSNDARIHNDMKWMQKLDAIFKNNYETDPYLGWQYFGTPRGALYRYPAMKWPTESASVSINEFRLSSWFVEAMTSPKDIVILLDTSVSLSEASTHLIRLTAKTILEALGDDDFVNIFSLDSVDSVLVPCFKDLLPQATARNKRKLLQAIKISKSNNEMNVTGALTIAFEILHRYNRTVKGSQCNQAIMLIVDNKVTSDYSNIFKEYNWPHKPIRIFTYLVGSGISKESELKNIACNNKGYYEHIEKPEEIREKVLNYLLVMARPLVMYENNHPIHWSSVYLDGKEFTSFGTGGQLVITVSTAAFDKRKADERTANVLGVAAADIPVQELKKLVPPNKLGANAYSFLINNNGRLIYHPELQIPNTSILKQTALEVDFSDVEFLDVNLETENNTLLLELRRDMIDQREGELDIRLKIHYDSMRRITFRSYKYFYYPVFDTPFSLGIALPADYGMYEVIAEEEVKRSSVNVTDFFHGRNWTVHPDWVYCDYHYPEYKDFNSPEEKVLHFLNRAIKPGWKWMSMRPRPVDQNLYLGEDLPARNINSYFCDKNLIQSLIFDAKITQEFENPTSSFSANKHDKHHGHDHFGIKLTFIATRSGLLRWRDYTTNNEPISGKPYSHFSFTNTRSIDEIWYRRAVDHYEIENESFVYSVPFTSGGNSMNNPLITATHAIFVENQGYKAPVAVVGIQFQYRTLAAHFLNITAACMGGSAGCKKTCTSDDLDCYVLDDNGFIIISEKAEHAGQFFGEIDGTIMDSLVQDGIYKKVFVYNHQASCEDNESPILDSASRISPFQSALSLTSWIFTHLFWFISKFSTYQLITFEYIQSEQLGDENPIYSEEYDNNIDESSNMGQSNNFDYLGEQNLLEIIESKSSEFPAELADSISTMKSTTSDDVDRDDKPSPPPLYVPSPHKMHKPRVTGKSNEKLRICTKKVALYTLQPTRLNNSGSSNPLKGKLTNCHATGCERPFSVQKIPHSNLMLLVVDTLCPCGSKQLSISPKEVIDNECNLKYEHLYRRRMSKCVNYHPEELEIQQCGSARRINMSPCTIVVVLTILNSAVLYAFFTET